MCHARESGHPDAYPVYGFPLEFTPAEAGAGMTILIWTAMFYVLCLMPLNNSDEDYFLSRIWSPKPCILV